MILTSRCSASSYAFYQRHPQCIFKYNIQLIFNIFLKNPGHLFGSIQLKARGKKSAHLQALLEQFHLGFGTLELFLAENTALSQSSHYSFYYSLLLLYSGKYSGAISETAKFLDKVYWMLELAYIHLRGTSLHWGSPSDILRIQPGPWPRIHKPFGDGSCPQ